MIRAERLQLLNLFNTLVLRIDINNIIECQCDLMGLKIKPIEVITNLSLEKMNLVARFK